MEKWFNVFTMYEESKGVTASDKTPMANNNELMLPINYEVLIVKSIAELGREWLPVFEPRANIQ